jgi:hypothetical protein
MKITVRQAGGAVGYLPGLASVPGHEPTSVETAGLGRDERAQLERLVEESGIVGSPPPAARGYPGAERLITIEIDGKSHTARFPEGEFPAPVRQLIDAVRAAAERGPASGQKQKIQPPMNTD